MSGYDFEEMFSLGEYAFCIAFAKYDPSTGVKFSAWVYRICSWSMINYTKRYSRPTTLPQGSDFEQVAPVDLNSLSWTYREQFRKWGAEARYVVWLVLDAPREVLNLSLEATPTQLRSAVRKCLSNHGWNYQKIQAVFDNLRKVV